MSRRPSLPGAAELFRSTGGPGGAPDPSPRAAPRPERATDQLARLGTPRGEGEAAAPPSPPTTSGRPAAAGASAEPAGCAATVRRTTSPSPAAARRPGSGDRQARGGKPAERPGEARREDHRLPLRPRSCSSWSGRGCARRPRMVSSAAGSREAVAVVLATWTPGASSILVRRPASRVGSLPPVRTHTGGSRGALNAARSAARSRSPEHACRLLVAVPVQARVRCRARGRSATDRHSGGRSGTEGPAAGRRPAPGARPVQGRWRPCSAARPRLGVTPDISLRSGRLARAAGGRAVAVLVPGCWRRSGRASAVPRTLPARRGPGTVLSGSTVRPKTLLFFARAGDGAARMAVLLALVPLPPLPGWRLLEVASPGVETAAGARVPGRAQQRVTPRCRAVLPIGGSTYRCC
jgi:hypothetical protein